MFHFVIFHINQPCVSTCTWYSKKKDFSMRVWWSVFAFGITDVQSGGKNPCRRKSTMSYIFFLLRRIYFGMCRDYMTGIEMNAEIRRIRICGILSTCQNGWTTTLNRVPTIIRGMCDIWWQELTRIDKQTNTFSLLGFDPDLVGKKGRKLVDRYFRACLFNIRLLYI